jgi:hypothetical protein
MRSYSEGGGPFGVDGRSMTANAESVTDDVLVGYMSHAAEGAPEWAVLSWRGDVCLGRARVVSSWRTTSPASSRRYAVRITTPSGALYHGRTFGSGLIVHARRVKANHA